METYFTNQICIKSSFLLILKSSEHKGPPFSFLNLEKQNTPEAIIWAQLIGEISCVGTW